MTPAELYAHTLRLRLAEEYRRIASVYTEHADRLEQAPLERLAMERVPYVHRSTRDLEDALDAALVAL